MAKRSSKKKATIRRDFVSSWDPWLPYMLAAVAFALYLPSLQSDFVYDARIDILSEGFITSLSNLPAVLSLKVLGMNLILADRPGQILYLMLNAALWGKEPWGYHLLSNLLHAANVALLFVLLRRLVAAEPTAPLEKNAIKTRWALIVVTLLFAVHPIGVEAVSAINYSSDLLVTFFTFLALLAGISFRVDDRQTALLMGGAGTLCAFASVACKESGLATCLLLIVYWFLFRRQEVRSPWLIFLSATVAVTIAFLIARFHFAANATTPEGYLGGSFSQVFLIQPRLWVYMMAKLPVPIHFSADYTLDNVSWISSPVAIVILTIVVSLQVWLATRSRIGALGVAVFWLGLATVSNFIPLYKILADRFYYMPMAGVALQLMALWLMSSGTRLGTWSVAVVGVLLVPLTGLTVVRENVFASDISLWTDGVQASPSSWEAHYNLGAALSEKGQTGSAMLELQKAVELSPKCTSAYTDMGGILLKQGQVALAITQFQKALQINPEIAETLGDLGVALSQQGRVDEAIVCYRKAERIKPELPDVYYNLGAALVQKGNIDEAIEQFQKMLVLRPTFAEAHTQLGILYAQQGKAGDSVAQFQEVVRLTPNDPDARHNLATEQAAAEKAAVKK